MKKIALLSLLLLAGCATREQLAIREDAYIQNRCAAMGVAKDDPRLMECMIAMRRMESPNFTGGIPDNSASVHISNQAGNTP